MIQTGTSAVNGFVDGIGAKIEGAATNAGNAITNYGAESNVAVRALTNTAGVLVDQVGEAAGTVLDTAGDIVINLGDVLNSALSLDKVGVSDNLLAADASAAKGINGVIGTGATVVNSAISNTAGTVQSVPIVGTVAGAAAGLGNSVVNQVANDVQSTVNTAAGVKNTAVGSSNIIVNAAAKPLAGTITSGLSGVIGGLAAVQGVAMTVKNIPLPTLSL